ncbi:hypothetical protein AB0B85_06265 [Micromonospora sp. NPDC049044]
MSASVAGRGDTAAVHRAAMAAALVAVTATPARADAGEAVLIMGLLHR